MLAIDLDELPVLHEKLSLFSVNAPNAYAFREKDYLPTGEPAHAPQGPSPRVSRRLGLKERVLAHLSTHGIEAGAGARVELVTLPRILGYLFNPVSFYFCYNRTGECIASIAEVTNTFREVKPYLLGPETKQAGTNSFRLKLPKNFYVSPFSDVDVAFDFILRPAGRRLAIQIDDYEENRRTFTSSLHGAARPLSDLVLAGFLFKYPLLTLRVIGLIHWHALKLYLKRVPWFAKAARATDQTGLYRPHGSLTSIQPTDS